MADGVDGFAAVDDSSVERFHRDGYLVIRDAFTGSEVAGALDEMLELLALPDSEFGGIHFEHSAPRGRLAALAPEQRQDYVRKFFRFVEPMERGNRCESPILAQTVSLQYVGTYPWRIHTWPSYPTSFRSGI